MGVALWDFRKRLYTWFSWVGESLEPPLGGAPLEVWDVTLGDLRAHTVVQDFCPVSLG